jgi:hypothetical protein
VSNSAYPREAKFLTIYQEVHSRLVAIQKIDETKMGQNQTSPIYPFKNLPQ